MHRREALALLAAGTVLLAGCSSGDGGDEANETPSTNETPTDNATEDPVDDPTDNTTDPSDDGNSSDGDEPEGPTEEELAQEDVDAAQDALSEAVSALENQGTTYGSLSEPGDQGPPATAGVSGLSDGPIRDQLSSVQSAIDDAREHETTGDQDETLTAIETAKDWLHTVLDAYQPVRDLYLEANYAVQDYSAEGSEADVQAVRRSTDQAQSPVDEVTDPYNEIENVGRLDAISQAGFEAQRDRIQAELESGRAIADAIEALQAGGELFWPARETYRNEGPGAIDGTPFENAEAEYDTADSTRSNVAGSFGAAGDYLDCYCPEMAYATEEYKWALSNSRGDLDENAAQNQDNAESALDSADGCSFDWSA